MSARAATKVRKKKAPAAPPPPPAPPPAPPATLDQACRALARIAPLHLAQSWDNVGLLAGDPTAPVRRIVVCIDLTRETAKEAVDGGFNLAVAYHPPIFKPVSRLCAHDAGPEANVFRCLAAGVAVYALHTALDAAPGGTNDVLASLCGLEHGQPLEFVEPEKGRRYKLVTFVPDKHLDDVAAALFDAGAGIIGDYTHCSYRLMGYGTFLGGPSTHPAVGTPGKLERVDEIRLETVVKHDRLAGVVAALRRAHPYEEPAFDVYPLQGTPLPGIGRVGDLARPTTLMQLARRLKRAASAKRIQVIGSSQQRVERLVVVAGAAGRLPLQTTIHDRTAIVTGEIRHHDALEIRRRGACAVALGHWSSERPVLATVAKRLGELLPQVEVTISAEDAEPLQAF